MFYVLLFNFKNESSRHSEMRFFRNSVSSTFESRDRHFMEIMEIIPTSKSSQYKVIIQRSCKSSSHRHSGVRHSLENVFLVLSFCSEFIAQEHLKCVSFQRRKTWKNTWQSFQYFRVLIRYEAVEGSLAFLCRRAEKLDPKFSFRA